MTLQIELWQMLSGVLALCGGFFSVVAWFARKLIAQFELRLDERFKARDESLAAVKSQMESTERRCGRVEEHVQSVEMQFMRLLAELPKEYVRREDWIRFGGSMDAKLDWLRTQTESLSKSVAKLTTLVKHGSNNDGG